MPIERLCCLLLGAAIVVRLFVTGIPAPLAVAPWDRIAHACVYALACALFLVGTARRLPLAVAAIVAVAGAFDEIHQAFRPGGHADTLDFVADACGAFFAASVMSMQSRKDPECAESLEP
ncbi:MAG TPA: VanZ family protein [Burkholderiales bacterium]|nr:VanZ family protein [Burkholderiales bacterium]